MFKPFSSSCRKGGTGLGLVIVRDIVHEHGGEITLTRSDENGTTFQIVLPSDIKEHPSPIADETQSPRTTPSRLGSAPPVM